MSCRVNTNILVLRNLKIRRNLMKKVILSIVLVIVFIMGLSVLIVGVGTHEESLNKNKK